MARPQRQDKKPDLTAVYAFMGLAIVAILVAAFAFQQRKAKENAQPAKAAPVVEDNPFADINTEPPAPRDPSAAPKRPSRRLTDLAPSSLLTERVWVDASSKAKLAKELLAEAEAAKANGKLILFEQKAVAGREMLDEQLVLTADWESSLFEQYGQNDRLVKQIAAERNRWFDQVKKYRKVGIAKTGG